MSLLITVTTSKNALVSSLLNLQSVLPTFSCTSASLAALNRKSDLKMSSSLLLGLVYIYAWSKTKVNTYRQQFIASNLSPATYCQCLIASNYSVFFPYFVFAGDFLKGGGGGRRERQKALAMGRGRKKALAMWRGVERKKIKKNKRKEGRKEGRLGRGLVAHICGS